MGPPYAQVWCPHISLNTQSLSWPWRVAFIVGPIDSIYGGFQGEPEELSPFFRSCGLSPLMKYFGTPHSVLIMTLCLGWYQKS